MPSKRASWSEASRQRERETNRIRYAKYGYAVVDSKGNIPHVYGRKSRAVCFCGFHPEYVVVKVQKPQK